MSHLAEGPETGVVKVVIAATLICLTVCTPLCYGGEKIKTLVVGHQAIIDALDRIFNYEPLVDHDSVIFRQLSLSYDEFLKLIRLYFPRNYEKMKTYDLILLVSTEYNYITTKQDQWIYDVIKEDGAGGINDGSVFSVVAPIPDAWANSIAQQAFPNDAPAVIKKGGGRALSFSFTVVINPDHPEPILTPFIPFGVERAKPWAATNMVIAREAARVLAWQVGSFPGMGKVDYLANWEFGNGRSITCGDFLGNGWLGYPGAPESNPYSPEIILNMIFWLTKRPLIDDIVVFHRVKTHFNEFRSRLGILVGLRDFIDKFGANTQKIQDQVEILLEAYEDASELYMESKFIDSEAAIKKGLEQFAEAEEIARKEKDAALLWVYIIEWLVSSSTLFLSGFVLWTLMVKRRLYREVKVTRLEERLDGD